MHNLVENKEKHPVDQRNILHTKEALSSWRAGAMALDNKRDRDIAPESGATVELKTDAKIVPNDNDEKALLLERKEQQRRRDEDALNATTVAACWTMFTL